jgi:hypothetical protein
MIWRYDAEKLKQLSIANATEIVYDRVAMKLILARILLGSLMPGTHPA